MSEIQDRIRRLAAVLAVGEEPAVAGKILLHGEDFARREKYPMLSAADVAKLYHPRDPGARKDLEERARQDLASGALSPYSTTDMTTFAALALWENRPAMQEGHPLADFLPFAVHTTPSPRKDCRHTGKREKQIQTIEATARTLKYEPLDIPEGGRAAIKAHCLEHHFGLFTDSGFEHAWKEANRQGRIRIYRKERFLAR